jgi:hypothetical protein
MKYAFIVLIALYLLVYGCGPDTSKKSEGQKGHTVQSSEQKTVKPSQAKAVEKQPVAAVIESPQPTQQMPAAPTAPTAQSAAKAKQPPAATEEQKVNPFTPELQQPPCQARTEQQGAIELTQPDDENIVVMPCGCIFDKKRIPQDAPCLRGWVPPCQMMGDTPPAAEDNLFEMPCGHVFLRHPMAAEDIAAGAPQQPKAPCQMEAQPQIVEESEQNLATAIEKMVETTDDMVLVTKQLVIATQAMLKATKGVTLEVTNLPADQTSVANRDAVVTSGKRQTISEEEVANALKEAVIATQRAIDVINQATSKALEPK